eukprot:scaffold671920_cov53-Prasinocladus_malaysianus.AAC.1
MTASLDDSKWASLSKLPANQSEDPLPGELGTFRSRIKHPRLLGNGHVANKCLEFLPTGISHENGRTGRNVLSMHSPLFSVQRAAGTEYSEAWSAKVHLHVELSMVLMLRPLCITCCSISCLPVPQAPFGTVRYAGIDAKLPVFRGLRVRVGMHTGIAEVAGVHEITKRATYGGRVWLRPLI